MSSLIFGEKANRIFFPVALAGVFLLSCVASAGAVALAQDQIDTKARSYLGQIDANHYDQAWTFMAPLFKDLNSQSLWQNRHQVLRDAYGPLVSRLFHRISYRQSYSNSPDGQYVIIQFKSIFQNKATATETVVFDCQTDQCLIREYVIN